MATRQQIRQQIRQRRREESLGALAELGDFLGVTHRRQPNRLLDDDDLFIDVAKDHARPLRRTRHRRASGSGLRWFLWWFGQAHLDALAALKAALGIDTRRAIDAHLPISQQTARGGTRQRQPSAQTIADGPACLGSVHDEETNTHPLIAIGNKN
jgi:hypothetical protein